MGKRDSDISTAYGITRTGIRGVRLTAPPAASDASARATTPPRGMSAVAPRLASSRGSLDTHAKTARAWVNRGRDLMGTLTASHRLPLVIAAVALVLTASLYGPTRDWYVALRHGQDLQARYAALKTENESIAQELSRLQTRDGIEDEARRRGYVLEGETGVVVENLPEEMTKDGDAHSLTSTAKPDDRGALISLLDLLFGYQAAS